MALKDKLKILDDNRYQIPVSVSDGMRVPGIIYTDTRENLPPEEGALQQVANVATLPGIVRHSLAMPDIHSGYGFPIGGVAATALRNGVISPGGVGFDINCGVRLLKSDIESRDARRLADTIGAKLFSTIPSGVGSRGDIVTAGKNLEDVLTKGAGWALAKGYGWDEDIEFCEENGCLETNTLDGVSETARDRGRDQIGTLGAGNHFIEVQEIAEIFDERAAADMGLHAGCVTVMIHSGSRGLGAQVCQDSIRLVSSAMKKYGVEVPDRQLACVPVDSDEGREYYAAMAAAANYAWANRHCMAHLVRGVFEDIFKSSAQQLGLHTVYDVSHNIAKFEEHVVDGKPRELCVHRKGATRAYPPGHKDIPSAYNSIGQPVLIPGDMGRASYVLTGTEKAMSETWGSVCHGAGRCKSRTEALKQFSRASVISDLDNKGIILHARNRKTIAEEAPGAYKNVADVVAVCEKAGLANKVALLKPIIVIKG